MSDIKTWRQQLEEIGGYENELVGVPAGSVRKMIDRIEELEAKLAELEEQEPYIYLSPKGRPYATMELAMSNGEQMAMPLSLAAGAREAPPPPHECKTEDEKLAYAFGWWKALEQTHYTRQSKRQPMTDVAGLVAVLRGGRQCDEDGEEIIMSRQACCEAADFIEAYYGMEQ